MSTLGGGFSTTARPPTCALTLLNSTVSGNIGISGGGILSRSGGSTIATLTIANSTISGNTAGGNGGGIGIEGAGSVALLTNSTITANRADGTVAFSFGGGIFVGGGAVTLRNTLVAGNFVVNLPITGINDVSGALDPASAFSLIGTEGGMTGVTNGTNGNQVGTQGSPIDPRLGPLQDNGGPTFTHAFLPASPALDAGDNTLASNAGLTLDQRGAARVSDGSDANTIDTVDIGAFEARASMTAVPDRTVAEDGSATLTFDVGDLDLISTIVATSSNSALVPNNSANLALSGSGTTRTLTITPVANAFGIATITVTVTSGSEATSDALQLIVGTVPDAPQSSAAVTNEDTQKTNGIVITRSAVDGPEVTHFRIGQVINGTLFLSDGTTLVQRHVYHGRARTVQRYSAPNSTGWAVS